jgi:DNA (cytosine-5)-methyltransferase 1
MIEKQKIIADSSACIAASTFLPAVRILNLYAGIGGNRKLWEGVDVTSVEFREDIADVYRHYFPGDKVIVADAHQYLLDHYEEFDFIWASPPCQTHSRARMWGFKNNNKVEKKYPDMKLYQEILFLQHYFKGKWVVENVNPFYEPLINPTKEMGRHLFWSNFKISNIDIKEADINRGTRDEWSKLHGFDLSNHKLKTRKDQIYRNCVHPETGLHIFECFKGNLNRQNNGQVSLFAEW